jgi:hypothetical protein
MNMMTGNATPPSHYEIYLHAFARARSGHQMGSDEFRWMDEASGLWHQHDMAGLAAVALAVQDATQTTPFLRTKSRFESELALMTGKMATKSEQAKGEQAAEQPKSEQP